MEDDGANVQDENLVNDQVAADLTGAVDESVAPNMDASAAVPPMRPPADPVPTPAADPVLTTEPVIPMPSTDDLVAPPTVPEEPTLEAIEAQAAAAAGVVDSAPPLPEPTAPVTPPVVEPAMTEQPAPVSPEPVATDQSNLEAVKQNAIVQLTPLVDSADLPPEEKFEAYMMIIRANDDASLIKPAYDIAEQITDSSKRAQALLDIVSEVNYLTKDKKV